MINEQELGKLSKQLKGELRHRHIDKLIYATDASAYRELPTAIAFPKDKNDLRQLIKFANEHDASLIPRAAGTSLAGQVVGSGIVVDISRHFTKIKAFDKSNKRVTVQPGVIRDELNMFLKPYGYLFGPETSTANRAMIGGMIGNNSCGSNSIVFGSTRNHLVSVKTLLSDGSEVEFKKLTKAEFEEKCGVQTLEGSIYRNIKELLSNPENRVRIEREFPKPSIDRRNTGYAIDLLKDSSPFGEYDDINLCTILAGSEGTLAFITEAVLNVEPLLPPHKALICAHFESIDDALKANLIGLKYGPSASELMDHYILESTKNNIRQRENRFFVQGDPKAILVIELFAESEALLEQKCSDCIEELKGANLGYHYPIVIDDDIKKVWELRKAGLGLLSNMAGDAKPAPVIEDTAVDVHDLPAYIEEFNETLKKYNLYCVHYAHAGSGELHLRPILNLKTKEGVELFRTILDEIAQLVKKYKGSLSGEHGDGRLRGEFIPHMIGNENYELLRSIKRAWDPKNIFNPGKIVDTPAMDIQLRFEAGQQTPEFDTTLNFDSTLGILRAAEQCNGSGDCRKTHLTGGTMCPSYMATKDEKDTTRARANVFREILTNNKKANAFDSEEIKEALDLCLSCKGCKAECPSNVDMGKLKAEFQHQYYKANGIPLRNKIIGNFSALNKLALKSKWGYNIAMNSSLSGLTKSIIGFHPKRSMPKLAKQTVRQWFKKNGDTLKVSHPKKAIYIFCDEFTNYNDAEIGVTTLKLLSLLGYEVKLIDHPESGRSFLSKGLLDQAKEIAHAQVTLFSNLISKDTPLIGIEPSAILSFRDEYIDLMPDNESRERAIRLSANTMTLEEFIGTERENGQINSDQFTDEFILIKLHGHCHQKALSGMIASKKMLTLPKNYKVELIPSGCCGMAGSFGYEKEHYELSMEIGELVLFPTIRRQPKEVIIAAAGTSCRHQIKDGVNRKALHPAEILFNALKK